MGLFLWLELSLLSPAWIITGVEGGEDDAVAGDAQDRHGEHYHQGTAETLQHDDPPGHGPHGDVLTPFHLDSVTDRACKDGEAGALGDDDEVQPGGEVDVGKP